MLHVIYWDHWLRSLISPCQKTVVRGSNSEKVVVSEVLSVWFTGNSLKRLTTHSWYFTQLITKLNDLIINIVERMKLTNHDWLMLLESYSQKRCGFTNQFTWTRPWTLSLDSDDFCKRFQNVSHQYGQQSISGLLSFRWSDYMIHRITWNFEKIVS